MCVDPICASSTRPWSLDLKDDRTLRWQRAYNLMISMPALIFLWYYFVGWLLDRSAAKRKLRISGGN